MLLPDKKGGHQEQCVPHTCRPHNDDLEELFDFFEFSRDFVKTCKKYV